MESPKGFNISMAGRLIRINPLYEAVEHYCKGYIVSDGIHPDFEISISPSDIENEKLRGGAANNEGRLPSDYPDSYIEILAVYRKIANEMLRFNTLLMHGSAVEIDGMGLLISADSGTGKSTLAENIMKVFGDRACYINDDKPLIRLDTPSPLVCGGPWSGKTARNSPKNTPLKVILKLERGEENRIEPLSDREIWELVRRQGFTSSLPANAAKILSLEASLIGGVRFAKLICTKEKEAAEAAYSALIHREK